MLKMYHRHALDIFNATSDLKAVFDQVEEYEATIKGGTSLYRMFFPVKPMLAGKLTLVQIAETLRQKLEANPQMPILIETKYDGERIQCHM